MGNTDYQCMLKNQKEFLKSVHQEASKWRNEKIRRILEKPENERTTLETEMIDFWFKHYGNRTC